MMVIDMWDGSFCFVSLNDGFGGLIFVVIFYICLVIFFFDVFGFKVVCYMDVIFFKFFICIFFGFWWGCG